MNMESESLKKAFKGIGSNEGYKEMWMSLFDISVISSCSGKDPDLFCASALLKTAFFSFIKLKRRLMETEELLVSQRLAIEALKREKTFMNSKLSSSSSAVCARCGFVNDDRERLPGERSPNLHHTVLIADDADKDCQLNALSSEDEIIYSQKVAAVKQDQQNFVEIPISNSTSTEMNAVDEVNLDDDDVEVNGGFAARDSVSEDYHPETDVTHCVTPKKRKPQPESQDISPILKFKKPRLSPSVSLEDSHYGKVHVKSQLLHRSEITSPVKKSMSAVVSHGGIFSMRRKISPVSLSLKKNENLSLEVTAEEASPASQKCENEEAEIILPSPVSPKNMGYFSGKGISSLDVANNEDPRPENRKIGKSKKPVPADTEMTFFLPMEESNSGNSDEENLIIEEEAVDEDQRNETLLDSFDQFPSKSDTPSYRYQRAAVRKKKDRRKLFGWECKDCQKYYEAAALSPGERREHVNKCSRHRDKFAPQDHFPEGFWNPVFPDTPK